MFAKKTISSFLLSSTALLTPIASHAVSGIVGSGSTPADIAAAASDFAIYKQVGSQLVLDNTASLSSVLAGNASAPGGNVELFASSETLSNAAFNAYTGTTSLVGNIGGNPIKFSSLNASDWASTLPSGKTLLDTWVTDLVKTYIPNINPALLPTFVAAFVANKGEQRFSDPNISYAFTQGGNIKIGLAGFLDAKPLFEQALPGNPLISLLDNIQISELVKVQYNGETNYLYGFKATPSGLTAANDGISFTGNYELSLKDPLAIGFEPVPIPAAAWLFMSGLVGMVVTSRRRNSDV